MKIRGVMVRKGDTPDYVNKMQQEFFEVLASARSLENLTRIEAKALKVTGGTWTNWTVQTFGSLLSIAGSAGLTIHGDGPSHRPRRHILNRIASGSGHLDKLRSIKDYAS